MATLISQFPSKYLTPDKPNPGLPKSTQDGILRPMLKYLTQAVEPLKLIDVWTTQLAQKHISLGSKNRKIMCFYGQTERILRTLLKAFYQVRVEAFRGAQRWQEEVKRKIVSKKNVSLK